MWFPEKSHLLADNVLRRLPRLRESTGISGDLLALPLSSVGYNTARQCAPKRGEIHSGFSHNESGAVWSVSAATDSHIDDAVDRVVSRRAV
jgi:hypothetical protein